MSWLHTLSSLMGDIGRGAEDVFTLGGTELARKFGGQGAKNVLDPLATGLGSNFTAGAVGGSGMLGANALGMGGTGASAMTPYMPTSAPNMGMAGSSLGAGGMSSPLSLSGPSSAMAPTASSSSFPMMGMGGGGQRPQGPNPRQQLLQQILQMIRQQQQGGSNGL